MIPSSIPITFLSALVRRCVDSYTGRLAPVPSTDGIFSFGTVLLASSAFPAAALLYNTYNQLRNGTLVRVGTGHKFSKGSTSRHTIQRRVKNNSWFLRNARSCRNKYTDAVFKIAKQSYDSLHKLHPNGFLHDTKLNIKIPYFRSSESRENVTPSSTKDNCSVIYSNEQFERNSSNHDLKSKNGDKKREERLALNRPTTRSLMRNNLEQGANKTSKEVQTNKKKVKPKFGKPKLQKITRKTRSGRVYAYRL